ncbi:voltage-dependent anion channel [Aspergillus granulosus]|uniref:Voltage-dependent anion channel n=1 Tax=Aspergillus granulosus TaxID=176169 RepID=A0ABR4H8J0_9EURO
MGTGMASILLYFIPFKAKWLYYLSIVLFVLNTVFFCIISLLTVLRYCLFPKLWRTTLCDPMVAPFLGTAPIAFATLVELWVFICVPHWGEWASTMAWAFWIVDAVGAVILTMYLSFLLMSKSRIRSLEMVTAVQLLPLASTIIASGVGAEVAEVLPSRERAIATTIASFVLWGMSMPLAAIVLAIYYQRLAVHKLPAREVIVSCFLPVGPLGFGSYTIMYLGKVTHSLFADAEPELAIAAKCVQVVTLVLGLIIWGFGLTWLFFALASIYTASPFPFNMGWWGFTFPLGVYAASTILIGNELPSLVFQVLGTVLSAIVILLWVVVSLGTVRGIWKRTLFVAPSPIPG